MMAIPYKIVTKIVPDKSGKTRVRYHLQATDRRIINLRRLSRLVSKNSHISQANVVAVLEALLEEIPDQLGNGNIIKMGDFGTFYPNISSEGSNHPQEVNDSKVRKITATFKPGKVFKDTLNRAGVELDTKDKYSKRVQESMDDASHTDQED